MAKTSTAQLDFGLLVLDPEKHRIESQKKARRCLSCSKNFSSHGPGNRICGSCKSTEVFNSSPNSFEIHASF
jgi:Zn finger protein HypA/HybF involved in hydrogenase expression